MGREIATKSNKPRDSQTGQTQGETPQIHIYQTNKDQTHRTNMKSSKGKTTNTTQGDSHKDNS